MVSSEQAWFLGGNRARVRVLSIEVMHLSQGLSPRLLSGGPLVLAPSCCRDRPGLGPQAPHLWEASGALDSAWEPGGAGADVTALVTQCRSAPTLSLPLSHPAGSSR